MRARHAAQAVRASRNTVFVRGSPSTAIHATRVERLERINRIAARACTHAATDACVNGPWTRAAVDLGRRSLRTTPPSKSGR
jgi:hypothetical protein